MTEWVRRKKLRPQPKCWGKELFSKDQISKMSAKWTKITHGAKEKWLKEKAKMKENANLNFKPQAEGPCFMCKEEREKQKVWKGVVSNGTG